VVGLLGRLSDFCGEQISMLRDLIGDSVGEKEELPILDTRAGVVYTLICAFTWRFHITCGRRAEDVSGRMRR
jgi:hypothetical protein